MIETLTRGPLFRILMTEPDRLDDLMRDHSIPRRPLRPSYIITGDDLADMVRETGVTYHTFARVASEIKIDKENPAVTERYLYRWKKFGPRPIPFRNPSIPQRLIEARDRLLTERDRKQRDDIRDMS